MSLDTATASTPAVALRHRPRERVRRTLRPRPPRNLNPTVREVTADGEHCVFVSLSGGLGQHAEMLLDIETWRWVRDTFGTCWVLNDNGLGRAYVCAATRAVAAAAKQAASTPKANLARLIVERSTPLGKRCAVHANGDRLDMRVANLTTIRPGQRFTWKPTGPAPVILDGHV